MLEALRAVDRHLGIRTEQRVASTDANIPLFLWASRHSASVREAMEAESTPAVNGMTQVVAS